MRKLIYLVLLVTWVVPIQAQTAQEILQATVKAMGGSEKWDGIDYIRMKHAGHKYWLEQSENPDGPFIASYEVVEETRGVRQYQVHRKETTHQFQSKVARDSEVMINGEKGLMTFSGRSLTMPYQFKTGYDEWMRYAPEQLIFSGLANQSKFEGKVTVEGTEHFLVSFIKDELKHTLYINRHNYLLAQAEIESFLPYDVFNYPWGKFITKIKYSLQWLYPEDIRYPSQWDVYKLGKHFRSITIFDIDFRPKVDEGLFEIPADLPPDRTPVLVDKTPLNTEGIIEVAPGIHTIPGSWYVGHIEQNDGILVIEGPISSGYNAQHLKFLKDKYPNKPIKAVFATSDAWPHVGGIRQFAAQGIPIYTHRLNQEIISNVLKADHSLLPDAYQKSKPTPKFQLIDKEVVIDDPVTPVHILPINGEGGERMIALYFPKQKVLYASDLVQYNGRNGSFFSPQYLSEVKAMVDKHQLDVETVFAMHTSPLPWSKVLEALKNNNK